MKKLSKEDYLTLREGAEVIESDSNGDKVLLLTDGTYLKLFRVKRLITSARLRSYSIRFTENAQKLTKLSIPTVSVINTFKIPSIQRSAVHYSPLSGTTLRDLGSDLNKTLIEKLGAFIRQLHEKGIYFRSLHLGNIVLTPQNQLGLIDISDIKILKSALPEKMRIRNFHHLCRYQKDKEIISSQISHFEKALNYSSFNENIRPIFIEHKTPKGKHNYSHKKYSCDKETVVQIRQTTAGLMESTNQFLLAFNRKSYHIVVIFLKGSLSEKKIGRIAADDVIFLELPDKSIMGLKLTAVYRLCKLLKRYKPSVLFAHRYHSVWLAGITSFFIKAHTCFAVLHGNNQINRFGRREFIKTFLKNRFYFIGISNVVRQDLLTSNAGLLPSRVFATPNSIDIDTQKKYLLPRKRARELLKINSTSYVIGNIARLSPTKNQHFLIQAFAESLKQSPDLILVMIGDGKLESELKELVNTLGIANSVKFLGRIDRASDYMKAFDLFIMTSNDEGFGRVLLEAMTARCPIIATDIPAFVEVLGGSGTLVRPGDITGLSHHIIRHTHMDSEKIDEILTDQDYVLYDKFCLENFKRRFKSIYESLRNEK
jgi:glycosyltransferase involved in cell wall biosynthesis/tRNA A-37 threonylcarbamoyl transferase component Bud32